MERRTWIRSAKKAMVAGYLGVAGLLGYDIHQQLSLSLTQFHLQPGSYFEGQSATDSVIDRDDRSVERRTRDYLLLLGGTGLGIAHALDLRHGRRSEASSNIEETAVQAAQIEVSSSGAEELIAV